MHKTSIRGFILPGTLIFLFIFALLTSFSFLNIQLTLKANQESDDRERRVEQAIDVLHQLENGIQDAACGSHCIIPLTNPMDLKVKSFAWWQQNACSEMSNNYYVIESLGKDACAEIEKANNNHALIADYYRISLLSLSGTRQEKKILLQGTIIKAAAATEACQEVPHLVKIGSQMWREL